MGGHQAYGGWGAPNLEKAYNLPITKGKGQNVFIVDAYDNPDVSSDFNTYRSTMGLPASTLNKYNQTGQKSNYPQNSPGWGVEIDLDVDMASASCPLCTINLVEANSNQWSDLEAAEQEAVKLGGTIVSNSYDGTGATESDYDTKGVTYLASAGDAGYGLYDPATFDSVIAVGGTFLNSGGGKRKFTEVVWPDSGGGCSGTGESKPTWQKDKKCSLRTGNDIGAVSVGAAEYDTDSEGGWIEVDGTSISSPLVAGMVALAGNSTKQDGGENLWKLTKKQQKKSIYPVVTGNLDGCPASLGGTYLCDAGTKQFGIYGSPDGWGTPHGVGAL
jgi:subtilase family serine protease